MAWYVRDNGLWRLVVDPSTRSSTTWIKVDEGWVRNAGIWQRFFDRNVTPPANPLVSITQNVDNFTVAVSAGAGPVQPQTFSIWVKKNSTPSTIEGTIDQVVQKNLFNPVGLNEFIWTEAPTEGDTFYASAIVYSATGVPSQPVTDSKLVPLPTEEFSKYIDPVGSDSYNTGANGWASSDDDVIQGGNVNNYKGCWFYASHFDQLIGTHIVDMQIQISRKGDENGAAGLSNVRLCHHDNRTKPNGDPGGMIDETKIGELRRGEKKWFNVPNSWFQGFENGNANYRGLGLHSDSYGSTNPNTIATHEVQANTGNGRVFVTWTE